MYDDLARTWKCFPYVPYARSVFEADDAGRHRVEVVAWCDSTASNFEEIRERAAFVALSTRMRSQRDDNVHTTRVTRFWTIRRRRQRPNVVSKLWFAARENSDELTTGGPTVSMSSLGYAKDAIACVVFALLLLATTARDSTLSREWLQLGLVIAILFDGTYTLVPSLHNTRILDADSATLSAHALYVAVGVTGIVVLTQIGVHPLAVVRDHTVAARADRRVTSVGSPSSEATVA